MSEEKSVPVPKIDETKENAPLSQKIVKIKREKNKNGKHQYSVIYEGSDSTKGVWVDASAVTDPEVIADFEKRLAKKEKKKEKEKEKKEKEDKKKKKGDEKSGKKDEKKEESKAKRSPSAGGKQKASPVEKVFGLVSGKGADMVFSVKLKEKGYVEMSSKELKEKAPKELCDFLMKHIKITETPTEN